MKTVKLPSIQSNSQRFPSLQDEVNYGRQRGVRYGRLKIMKDRVIANNGTVDSIMLDADGLHAYNNSSQEIITVNYLGLHGYTTAGVEMVRVDATGFHGYDASGNELVRVNNTGTHYYNTSAAEIIKVDANGFHGYNASGNELVRLDTSGLTIYDTSGVKLLTSDNTGFETWRNSAGSPVSVAKMNENGVIARNTRGFFMEETNAGNYFKMYKDNSNKGRVVAPTGSDEIWFNYHTDPGTPTILMGFSSAGGYLQIGQVNNSSYRGSLVLAQRDVNTAPSSNGALYHQNTAYEKLHFVDSAGNDNRVLVQDLGANKQVIHISKTTSTPTAIAAGSIAVADGTTWNPVGDGNEHIMCYLNGAWNRLD